MTVGQKDPMIFLDFFHKPFPKMIKFNIPKND